MANSTLAGVIKLSALALSGSEGATDRLLDAIPAVVAALLGQSGVDEREASARARAAETFLSEAHRRYRAQPTDDGWRRDLDRARASSSGRTHGRWSMGSTPRGVPAPRS